MTPFTIRTSLAALAFVACGTGAALAQDSTSPILDSVRVRQLVASEAPADQAALAAHFSALADRHASAARLHDGMGRSAAGNPRGNGQEMKAHCQRLAGLERKASATLRELAAHHAALAGGSASTAPVTGAKYQAGAEAREPSEADMNALVGRAVTPADHRALAGLLPDVRQAVRRRRPTATSGWRRCIARRAGWRPSRTTAIAW